MIKFDPFKELAIIQNKMNELFERTASGSRLQREEIGSTMWHPSVDIYEADGNVVIEAELPGMAKEDISVTIEGNMLILKGERMIPKGSEEEHFLRIERTYGPFSRSFELTENIDTDAISAEHIQGVLTIKLPIRVSVVNRIGIENG